MEKFIINTIYGKICFEINENHWCVLSIKRNGQNIKLGADEINRICKKLVEKLSYIQNNKPFIYNNQKIYSVISLFDPHSTLSYRLIDNNTIQLMMLDKDRVIIPLIYLSEKERIICIDKIKLFISDYNRKYNINKSRNI